MYSTTTGGAHVEASSQTSSTIDTLPDELLLAILGALSLKDRAKVRTVSKKWNNLVMDLGIHLEPLFVDDQEGVPIYSNDIPIRLNIWAKGGLFDDLQVEMQSELPHAKLTRVWNSCSFWMHLDRHEFLTDPPISTLALHVTGPPETPRQPMHAMLRTATLTAKGSGGIRLGHLLDVFDQMRAYDTKLSLVGWGFAAWFATIKDGFAYVKVGERTTRNGIEVRKCTGTEDSD